VRRDWRSPTQIARPSRADALAYGRLREPVHWLVGRIDDRSGSGVIAVAPRTRSHSVVLYKFDRSSHEVSELRTDRLGELGAPFSLRGFSPRMFRAMCILSGVDYLESPGGRGLGTARQLVELIELFSGVRRALRQAG
jgi:hypothetical protein